MQGVTSTVCISCHLISLNITNLWRPPRKNQNNKDQTTKSQRCSINTTWDSAQADMLRGWLTTSFIEVWSSKSLRDWKTLTGVIQEHSQFRSKSLRKMTFLKIWWTHIANSCSLIRLFIWCKDFPIPKTNLDQLWTFTLTFILWTPILSKKWIKTSQWQPTRTSLKLYNKNLAALRLEAFLKTNSSQISSPLWVDKTEKTKWTLSSALRPTKSLASSTWETWTSSTSFTTPRIFWLPFKSSETCTLL